MYVKGFFRWFLFLLGLFVFVWFLLPFAVAGVLNIGNVTGMLLMLLVMVYTAFMPVVHAFVKKYSKRIWMRLFWGVFGAVVAFCMLLVLIETGCMVGACMKTPKEDATAIVLGCRVYGERASQSLKERIDAAYEYLTNHPDAVCVVTGGLGAGADISEAECMYRYLVEMGIDGERIYKEERATSTEENMKYSLEVIRENGLNENVAIITSEYHAYRAGIRATECGLSFGTAPSHTALWLFPTFYMRELYGILDAWVF